MFFRSTPSWRNYVRAIIATAVLSIVVLISIAHASTELLGEFKDWTAQTYTHNGKSVCTDTRATWQMDVLSYENSENPLVTYYRYETKYPHAGAGIRVQF